MHQHQQNNSNVRAFDAKARACIWEEHQIRGQILITVQSMDQNPEKRGWLIEISVIISSAVYTARLTFTGVNIISSYSAGIDFRRQNMTYVDVRL